MMLDGAKHAAVDKVFDAKSCLSSVPICAICGENKSWDHRCLGWAQMGLEGMCAFCCFLWLMRWLGLGGDSRVKLRHAITA